MKLRRSCCYTLQQRLSQLICLTVVVRHFFIFCISKPGVRAEFALWLFNHPRSRSVMKSAIFFGDSGSTKGDSRPRRGAPHSEFNGDRICSLQCLHTNLGLGYNRCMQMNVCYETVIEFYCNHLQSTYCIQSALCLNCSFSMSVASFGWTLKFIHVIFLELRAESGRKHSKSTIIADLLMARATSNRACLLFDIPT